MDGYLGRLGAGVTQSGKGKAMCEDQYYDGELNHIGTIDEEAAGLGLTSSEAASLRQAIAEDEQEGNADAAATEMHDKW